MSISNFNLADTNEGKKRADVGFLIGVYAICQFNMTPEVVFFKLKEMQTDKTVSFSVVNGCYSSWNLNILDTFKQFRIVISKGFFVYEELDLNSYEHDEKIFVLNWIIPNKSAAMMEIVFSHHDLSFEVGGFPNMTKSKNFHKIVDHKVGTVVLYCRARFGRTGALICTFLVEQYGFTIAEAEAVACLGILKMCQPSVSAFQQQYLHSRELAIYLQRLSNRMVHRKELRESLKEGIILQHISFELRGWDISGQENQGTESRALSTGSPGWFSCCDLL